jgi:hypothetical protein
MRHPFIFLEINCSTAGEGGQGRKGEEREKRGKVKGR